MTFEIILYKDFAARAEELKKTGYVCVYRPIAGWKGCQMWWNPDIGGFWEPWDTQPFAFNTKSFADESAEEWARYLDIPLIVDKIQLD